MKVLLIFSILLCAIGLPVVCQTSQNVVEMDIKESISRGFDDIEKHFDRQNKIIIACIGIPLTILAINAVVWGLLAYSRSGKTQALEKQIQILTEEIETLKQQRIVNP